MLVVSAILMLVVNIVFWSGYLYKTLGNEIGTYDALMEFVTNLNLDFGGSYLMPMYWGDKKPPVPEEAA